MAGAIAKLSLADVMFVCCAIVGGGGVSLLPARVLCCGCQCANYLDIHIDDDDEKHLHCLSKDFLSSLTCYRSTHLSLCGGTDGENKPAGIDRMTEPQHTPQDL